MLTSVVRYMNMARLEVRPWIWSLWILLYLSAFAPGRAIALALLSFISFQTLKEYFSIMPMRQAERPVLLLGYLTIPIQYGLVALEQSALPFVFIPLFIALLSVIGWRKYGATPQTLNSTVKIGWGVFTLVFLFSHLGLLLVRPLPEELGVTGESLSLYLLLVVNVQIAVQLSLTRLGVNEWSRLMPGVLPLSLTGPLSILAAGVVGLSLGPWLTAFSRQTALWASLMVGASAYLGNATLRALFHMLETSEDERLIPGLGGILTFLYPLVYAAPLFFYMYHILYG
ncbi:MAG: hypothetical protein R3C14_07875 [Caldilineaceae bacterium]